MIVNVLLGCSPFLGHVCDSTCSHVALTSLSHSSGSSCLSLLCRLRSCSTGTLQRGGRACSKRFKGQATLPGGICYCICCLGSFHARGCSYMDGLDHTRLVLLHCSKGTLVRISFGNGPCFCNEYYDDQQEIEIYSRLGQGYPVCYCRPIRCLLVLGSSVARI